MTQQNNGCVSGCGLGCGGLLALMALGVVLAYWPLFLTLGLLALAIGVVLQPVLQQKQRQLQALVEAADRRVRDQPCQVRERFGVVESIRLAGDRFSPRIDIRCRAISAVEPELGVAEAALRAAEAALRAEELSFSLSPPPQQLTLGSASGLAGWLGAGGISLLDDLSVESKATTAAMACLRELDWIAKALVKLEGLRSSVRDTLAKADGNELLEPAIPQLRQALSTFDAERATLLTARRNSARMLRKLHDFLSVPAGIRPILNFDLDQLFDPQRLSALEQSFSEVVLLNDSFRQLSKDAQA